MTYWEIEAEVAGGLGPDIDYHPQREPRLVGPLHYEFAGWMGDDLVTTSQYWVVTERLARALRESGLSGFGFDEVVVTKDEQWDLMPHRHELPDTWERLVPTGSRADGDDVVLEGRTTLLVNDAALAVLRTCTLEDAYVSDVDAPAPAPDPDDPFVRAELDAREAEAERAARAAGRAPSSFLRARTPGEPLTGELITLGAAIGHPIDAPQVVAALALVPGPLEVEELGREVQHADRAHGLLVRVIDGVVGAIVVRPRRYGNYHPYPSPTRLIDGVDATLLMAEDLPAVFGEPIRPGARYLTYRLDTGPDTGPDMEPGTGCDLTIEVDDFIDKLSLRPREEE